MDGLTAAISRSPQGGAEERAFEDAVASALAEAGVHVLVIAHVYYLRPDHEAVLQVREATGLAAVATWLYPRAARWVLDALGGMPDGAGPVFLRLADFVSVEECVQAVLSSVDGDRAGPGAVEEITDEVAQRWYPVLDYERCKACGQCLDFCLFGTFSRVGSRVVATSPDNCKPGCPACARVCPFGAIMFPHHDADPVIAGAPGPVGQAKAAAREPAAASAEVQDGDLDDLMRALDEFDE